jgi:cytoskeletal protein RodZ
VAIGERLREARMRQKIDIAEVESATKIRAKYLRALENEEFSLLPGNTFVKTFLRTYSEYLGLDAQLMIEEYRAEHEPRGEGEVQPMVSPSTRRRQQERRRPRAQRGPPGPGTAVLVVLGVVLVILLILGLTGGSSDKGSQQASTTPATKKKRTRKPASKPAPPPRPTRVSLRIVPSSATYVCVDRGLGTPVLYQATTASPQRFKGRHLRVNIGNASTVRISANGKRVALPSTATIVGYDFRVGRSRPIPTGQTRPCA